MHNYLPAGTHESLTVDSDWRVQGRILPPSVTDGNGTILHLQIKHKSWEELHFHYGQCQVPDSLAVEIAMAVCTPYHRQLVCTSWDEEELEHNFLYLYMAKLVMPEQSLGLLTVTGKTVVTHIDGLNTLCGPMSECDFCEIEEPDDTFFSTLLIEQASAKSLDALMLVKPKEHSH